MAEAKQAPLNGAYYGPPIPPQHSYRKVGGRSSNCCCGPCCLLCTLIKFIVALVVILGIITLVLWLVFRPNPVKVYVEKATLTQFNLSNSTTLSYNLTSEISVRNPNKRIGIYYDSIEARAIYDGSRFGFVTLPTFYQDHKNTSMLYPAFQGQQLALGSSVSTTFDREKGEGFFYVDVELHTKVRLKVWFIKTNKYSPRAYCTLKLPVPSSANGTAVFSRTKCDVKYF